MNCRIAVVLAAYVGLSGFAAATCDVATAEKLRGDSNRLFGGWVPQIGALEGC